MGIKELASLVVAQHPELTPAKAQAVLRTALVALNKELGEAADGAVKYPPLGNFRLATKAAKEGESQGTRRITLRLQTVSEGVLAKEEAQKAKAEKVQAKQEKLKTKAAQQAKKAAKSE